MRMAYFLIFKSDGQTNIERYRVAAHEILQYIQYTKYL